MPEAAIPEVKREKVFIPKEMTISDIQKKYSFNRQKARNAWNKGFFVKNYLREQVLMTKESQESFNIPLAYNLSKKVYFKNFRYKYKIAEYLKEDLIQESVKRLWSLSAKTSTDSRFSDGYIRFWISHNAQLSYITKYLKQVRYKKIWKNAADVIRCYPDLTFNSNFTTC